jgi:hypothetical protein
MKRRHDPNQTLMNWTERVSPKAPEDSLFPEVKPKRKRTGPARLPVPQPLQEAVEKGNFGYDPDTDDPIKPGPREVRAITENHAERMIELLDRLKTIRDRTPEAFRQRDLLDGEYKSKLAMYAEDFGEEAAARLDSYVRHQADKDIQRRR